MSAGSQQLLATYKKSAQANMKRLNDLAGGNLELQQLLIRTAEDFVQQRAHIEESGSSVFEASQVKRRRRSGAADTGGDEEIEPANIQIPEGVELRRGLHVFRNWGTKMLVELLLFLAAALNGIINTWEKEELQKLVEYALDLRLFGEVLDRIGKTDKKELFDSLKQTYIALGSRLGRLNLQRGQRAVDWDDKGHFNTVSATSAQDVRLQCKLIQRTIVVPADVFGSDPGPFNSITNNFSRHSAALVTPVESYNLSSMFPQLSRSLLRRTSDVVGATGSAVAENSAAARDDPERSANPPNAEAVTLHEEAPPSPVL